MSRLFYHVMQDNAGNLLFDVSGTMRLAGTGTLATIYGDEALTVILPNPMTNHPSFGSFKCYLGASAAGYDFYMAKSGYTFETLTGVQGLGTMAQQDASAVAITGGSAQLTRLGVGVAAQSTIRLVMFFGTGENAIVTQPTFTGPAGVVNFLNQGATLVGSIVSTDTATAYNTISDARLKHAITPLTGALDVVRRLRPVSFLWTADGSAGRGFVAHELQREIPDAVTGEPDAVNDDGSVRPQGVDHSKLVPWLTGACQELLAQVQALTARVASLEDGLGV